jgi:hypothetical protein
MTGMVRDAKGELNHGSDPTAGPQLPPETIGFGTALQQGRQLSELLGSQSPRGAGWGAVAEGVGSPFTGTLHPLTDGPFADTQRRGDLALRPALLFELPGLVTSGFLPVMR